MKYRVIGWTYPDDFDFPSSNETIGFAERNAIIDEIRKHKYLFTGWHHQEAFENTVPILNDGKKREFSQRGFGGVMAEAYGQEGDYDYARFTFHESIDHNYLKFPLKCLSLENFKPSELKNEHFNIEVSKELFEIAKTKNPFYLDDLDELRFIDKNDTLTLHYQDESLSFFISDINRNKKEIKFKEHHLINTKYKIIVTHKNFPKKVLTRVPMIISKYEVNDYFKSCLEEYNFKLLVELFLSYDIDTVTNNSKNKKTINLLKRFTKEYSEYNFDLSLLIKLLRHINDYELYKEISLEYIDKYQDIIIDFINHFIRQNINMDEYIPLVLKHVKKDLDNMSDILLRAIELKPNNKTLRKRYYRLVKDYRNNSGLFILAGLDLYEYLSKEDRVLVNLDDQKKLSSLDVLKIIEILKYPKKKIIKRSIFDEDLNSKNNVVIEDGINKYRSYLNKKYNIENNILDFALLGIDKKAHRVEEVYQGYYNLASYIYELDELLDFKYDLKTKAINKYNNDLLAKEIDKLYKKLKYEINNRNK